MRRREPMMSQRKVVTLPPWSDGNPRFFSAVRDPKTLIETLKRALRTLRFLLNPRHVTTQAADTRTILELDLWGYLATLVITSRIWRRLLNPRRVIARAADIRTILELEISG